MENGWGAKQFPKDFEKNYGGRPTEKQTLEQTLERVSIQRILAKEFMTQETGNLLTVVDIPEETMKECVEKIEKEHPEMDVEERMKLAKAEATNEWLSANTVDFFNEVALLYGIVEDFHQRASDQVTYANLKEEFKQYKKLFPNFTNGFPQGFEYRVKTMKKDEKINGAQYTNTSMIWLEDQIDNPEIFPETELDEFPADFIDKHVSEMFKRMFRIFAIIYAVCWPVVISSGIETQVHNRFKHFYFFAKRFNLLRKKGDLYAFTKTKVKSTIDLDQLDQEYAKCQEELTKT